MSILGMMGASLIGGLVQSRAAGRAANVQADAARDAADAQVEAARIGANSLRDNTRLGLDAAQQASRTARGDLGRPSALARRDILTNERRARDAMQTGARQGIASLRQGRNEADGIVRRNTREIIAANDAAYGEQQDYLNPYASSGRNALDALNFELGIGDRPDDYAGFRATPGYEFQRSEGMRAIDGSAASRGGLFSGRTMQDAQTFGTGLADQSYNAFMDRLTGRANSGQQASNALAGFAGQRATNNNNARTNRMSMMAGNATNFGAGRADIQQGLGQQLASSFSTQGANIANNRTNTAQGMANAALGYGQQANNAFSNLGINLANNSAQSGNAQAEGFYNQGNAQSAGLIGQANAINDGIGNALGAMQFNTVFGGGGGQPAANQPWWQM